MAPAVSVADLHRGFGQVDALSGVYLKVAVGEMFALVGPDGAGKTTLLRVLAGLLPGESGEVIVLGCRLPEKRRRLKPRIGYLSQGFSLYGDLSVDENLAFFAEIYGVGSYRERREELLAFTRLEPFRRRLAGHLSGGMKKKLALACALIHRPELLLLDEPTTGVDPVSRRDFWLILGDLLHEGLTIIVATPYLDEAERCRRVGLLDAGRFLTLGPPGEIKNQIEGTIYEVVTPQARLARVLVSEQQLPGLLEMRAQGDRLHLRLTEASGTGDGRSPEAKLRRELAAAGVEISALRRIKPTLEDLFISLIAGRRR